MPASILSTAEFRSPELWEATGRSFTVSGKPGIDIADVGAVNEVEGIGGRGSGVDQVQSNSPDQHHSGRSLVRDLTRLNAIPVPM